MMECGQELSSGTMIDASGGTSRISSEQAKILTYKLVRVEKDGSFVPASEDEVTEVEHLLAEPKNENGLMDSVLGCEATRTNENLAIEVFHCPGDYGQINSDCGTMYSSTPQGGKVGPEFEFLDGMLHGVGGGDLHVEGGLSSACDDYLLDSEFSEKVPDYDYGPCGGVHLGSLDRDNNSPRLSEGERGAVGMSKSLTSTIPLESSSDQNSAVLEKMTIRELQETFKRTFGRETTVKDKQWLKRRITFGLQNLVELDSVPLFLGNRRSYNENEGNLIFTSSDDSGEMMYYSQNPLDNKAELIEQGLERARFSSRDAMATSYSGTGNVRYRPLGMRNGEDVLKGQKRMRKPTRRYIEESSDLRSRSCGERLDIPTTNSKDKVVNCNHRKGFGAAAVVYRQDSFKGSGIQVPFGLQVQKGRPKKNTSILGQYSEDNKDELGPSTTESQDDMSDDSVTRSRSEKGGSRRKHHRLWTLSEVVKLIDGVTQYGVGRWTEIKRLLFSSSVHRTSVDLKDKWRNLLRASGAQFPNKREVEQARKQAIRPIPPQLLRRVSELAIIYPYPRERKSKHTHSAAATATSPAPAPAVVTKKRNSASGDPSISRSGRIIHRKSLT